MYSIAAETCKKASINKLSTKFCKLTHFSLIINFHVVHIGKETFNLKHNLQTINKYLHPPPTWPCIDSLIYISSCQKVP